MSDIGKQIKLHRQKQSMTQKELGIILNVAVSTVSSWEKGHNQVSPYYYDALASALSIDKAELLSIHSKNISSPPTNSKPYIDRTYKFNLKQSLIMLIPLVFTFLAPLLNEPMNGLFILLWLLLTLFYSIKFLEKSQKPITLKYYHDDETLYYVHEMSKEKLKTFRNDRLIVVILTFVLVNISTVIALAMIHESLESILIIGFFSFVLILTNSVIVWLLLQIAFSPFNQHTMTYDELHNIDWFTPYRILIFFTFIIVLGLFVLIQTLNINPYQSFLDVLVYIFLCLSFILSYGLHEMTKKLYYGYKIMIKKR